MNTPCPYCGSQNIFGLLNSSFVELEDDKEKAGWSKDMETKTYLTDQRCCGSCRRQWIEDNNSE